MKQGNNMKTGIWNIFSGAIKIQLNDEKHILRNAVIQIVVATICFLMLIRVFPLNEVKHHYYSKQQAIKGYEADVNNPEVDGFSINDKKLQAVQFKRAFVHKITLYMDCIIDRDYRPEDAETMMLWDPNTNLDINEESTCTFRVYDESFSCIYSGNYNCKRISEKGKLVATCDIEVDTEKTYYYEILASESPAVKTFLPVAEIGALEQQENSTLFIDGIINNDYCLIADFEYSKDLNIIEQILMCILTLAISFFVYFIITIIINYMDKTYSNSYDKWLKTIKKIVGIFIALLGIITILYAVVLNKFGGMFADRVVYLIGIMVATVILEFCVVIDKNNEKIERENLTIVHIWEYYIQTVCFGFLFYALCKYVNAEREYYHKTNIRWMLILLAIILLMNIGIKKISNKFTFGGVLLFVVGSIVYCYGIEDAMELTLNRLTGGVVGAWGIVILNMLYTKSFIVRTQIDKNKKELGRYIYGIMWIAFSICMYINRFEKVWVFTATLPFVAFFVMKLDEKDRHKLLKAFSDGVIFSFVLFAFFCLRYRPYNKWLLYRYSGMFHTVACTGMYFVVVMGVILGKLFGRAAGRDKNNCASLTFAQYLFTNYKEVILAGMTMGFVILTMSRTAFVTIFGTGLAVLIVSKIKLKKNMLKVFQEICILGASVLLCFPLVYSAIRIVPAVVNKPVYYEFEQYAQGHIVIEGTPVDSSHYMDINRFFEVLFGRFSSEQAMNIQDNDNLRVSKESSLVYNNYNIPYEVVIALSEEASDNEEVSEENADVSNGRFHIFSECLKQIGFEGHKGISITDSEGQEFDHAHNSYLQVAYNFGIIAGILFVSIWILSIVYSIILFNKNGNFKDCYLVPFAMIVVFGFVSLTEWAFHPGIPAGFCFLFMQPLLIRK